MFCQTRSLSNATFFIFDHVTFIQLKICCCVQNLIKTRWLTFHRDMAVYRFWKWRPSAILELFYHTKPPTKTLLLAAAACQISSQSDTQIWRYSYLNFFAYLAWNPSIHPFILYQTTKVHRLGIHIKRYKHTAYTQTEMKCLFRPQNGSFGELWTPKCNYSSSRPPKGTSLRKSASFKLSTVKIRWRVWPVGELTESVTDTHTHTHR